MKIIKDDNDKNKVVVDFEGLEVHLLEESSDSINAISSLFNDDIVSEVRNGVFICDAS